MFVQQSEPFFIVTVPGKLKYTTYFPTCLLMSEHLWEASRNEVTKSEKEALENILHLMHCMGYGVAVPK